MNTNHGTLLTVQEVAGMLRVPVSWVYERTRRQSPETLPHIKVGKYLRFFETDVANYLQMLQGRNGGRRSSAA